MTAEKLSPAERGKLGGLVAAHRLGADGVARRARKGGNATLEKHGKNHFTRAAFIRWGRLSKNKATAPAKAAAETGGADATAPSLEP